MMQDIGVERYNLQQREKMQILSHLLANYNDGRRKLSKNNVHIFIIIKKKRYKVMPLISLLIFISFIGFGIISIISLVVPYGGTLIYPLGSIILGLIFIWDIFFNRWYYYVACIFTCALERNKVMLNKIQS